MLIKTVDTVITTNSAGQTVESLPVREVLDGETDIVGRPVTVIPVTEDANGVPVLFVTGKSVLNSAGQLVDTTPVKGGGIDYIDQILGAGGLDYGFFDFSRLPLLFQDAAGGTPVTAIGQTIGRANVKAKAPHNAQQGTSSFRPQLQAAGAKFDGSDDNLLSDWLAQAGANCIIARVTVPASLSATQVIAGAQVAGGTSRFWLGVNPSSGRLICGVGANGSVGGVSADIRNSEVVVALTCDGSTVKLYQDGAEVYSAAQSGSPTTAVASCIGCLNSDGIPFSHFGGAIRALAFGKVAPPLADIQKITTQLKALV